MSRIARPAIAVLALAICAWIYFAPYLTVRSMRLAAERGDAEALATHVDFPALRSSIKTQLADSISERIGGDDSGGIFGSLGARLATAISNPVVDAMVSPQALSLLFAGRGLARNGLAAATASDTGGERASSGIDLPHWNATMGYRDLGTFAVDLQTEGDPGIPASLIFKRHHVLWWKLSEIKMQTRR